MSLPPLAKVFPRVIGPRVAVRAIWDDEAGRRELNEIMGPVIQDLAAIKLMEASATLLRGHVVEITVDGEVVSRIDPNEIP